MSFADDQAAVLRYHSRTTHRPGRFAPGPGALDWANQPDPFRTYEGATVLELPLAGDDLSARWGNLHQPGAVPPRSLDRAALGAFLELAMGLTAWKEYGGSRWSLRANPSSGNLHPTEGYVVLRAAPGLPAGVHHYLSRNHVLEHRLSVSPAGRAVLESLLPHDGFLFGLASIHWREAWKYGERAFRYCQHDIGHALAAARYAAGVLGWAARLLESPADQDVSALLGLERSEAVAGLDVLDREHPDGLLLVAPAGEIDAAARRIEEDLDTLCEVHQQGHWAGRPNALGTGHRDWPAIAEATATTVKSRTSASGERGATSPAASGTAAAAGRPGDALIATTLIRQRRSAVAMDGASGLTAPAFFALLDRLLPRVGVPPWDLLRGPARVHAVLFVHRIEGLPPGVYLLERELDAHDALRAALRPGFAWERPAGCPQDLHLFCLDPGDARSLARFASCQQDIASDSAFAVAMIAEFEQSLERGPWWYRRLHWEAGVLGQALYLEAEAAGLRGTGIGCFFDDVVHQALGIADPRLRDLYHFTVGGAVEDRRLVTLPAYSDDVRRRS